LPTFVDTRRGVAVLGTPGGSRIATMVLLAVLAVGEGGTPADWVRAPRFHHQYLPDVVEYEPGAFSAAEVAGLAALGHRLEQAEGPWGNMQALWWDQATGQVEAASDPRGGGRATVVLRAP
jgi:gamma-glutamyltranspeptidase/glutathione hydrolase